MCSWIASGISTQKGLAQATLPWYLDISKHACLDNIARQYSWQKRSHQKAALLTISKTMLPDYQKLLPVLSWCSNCSFHDRLKKKLSAIRDDLYWREIWFHLDFENFLCSIYVTRMILILISCQCWSLLQSVAWSRLWQESNTVTGAFDSGHCLLLLLWHLGIPGPKSRASRGFDNVCFQWLQTHWTSI